jgi:hypothetical protein
VFPEFVEYVVDHPVYVYMCVCVCVCVCARAHVHACLLAYSVKGKVGNFCRHDTFPEHTLLLAAFICYK